LALDDGIEGQKYFKIAYMVQKFFFQFGEKVEQIRWQIWFVDFRCSPTNQTVAIESPGQTGGYPQA